jgi:uncharacterized protein (DUF427 family)
MARPQRIDPGPGQESVWDYPRPPRLVRSDELVVVRHAGVELAATTRSWRVLETSQPPGYYLPRDDVAMEYLQPNPRSTWCEWKGRASYWDIVIGDLVEATAAWSYEEPTSPFAEITGYLAFYPQRVDECLVDGERVRVNEGDFYGGWVTSRVVGPFKGAPGTLHW